MALKIYLPAMRDPIINGLRLGLGVALIGTLLAETKISNRGIGFMVIDAYAEFDMPRMYAILIVLFVLAIGANTLVARLGGLDDSKRNVHSDAGNPRPNPLLGPLFRSSPPAPLHPPPPSLQPGALRNVRTDTMNKAVPLRPSRRSRSICRKTATLLWRQMDKPISGRSADAIDPGTAKSLGPVAVGAANIDAAVNAAKAAIWPGATRRRWNAHACSSVSPMCWRGAEELAMIDAADCGNPYTEMVRDATIAAAQIEFYAGLVTEMKGSSIQWA